MGGRGQGSVGKSLGSKGTGVRYTMDSGQNITLISTGEEIFDSRTLEKINLGGKSVKSAFKTAVANGATPLSKAQVKKAINADNEAHQKIRDAFGLEFGRVDKKAASYSKLQRKRKSSGARLFS